MEKARVVDFPQFLDPRGNLAVIEQSRQMPFDIERVHWIYDVPGGGGREGHAYLHNAELIVALSGSFDLKIKYPDGEELFTLNRTYFGVYVPPMTWRELTNFSTNAVVLVLSSCVYDESEYITDYEEYLRIKEGK